MRSLWVVVVGRQKGMDYTHVVIGGGAVGLAVGARLARIASRRVLVIEKNSLIGAETSSRNSEVVHAGIYHPPDSLKSQLCIRGKELIYSLPDFTNFRKCGKFLVSQSSKETEYLHKLLGIAQKTGVPLELLPLSRAREMEPSLIVRDAVLHSPSSGIVDAHALMQYYQAQLESNGGDLALLTEVKGIEQSSSSGGWNLQCVSVGEDIKVNAAHVINSGGLWAPRIASMVGLKYGSFYAKGNYFSYSGKPTANRLIYPCPSDQGSLGTHLTIDMAGHIKFGPDLEWVDSVDYKVNPANLEPAKQAIARYMDIDTTKLTPDYSGIRPKLSTNTKEFTDFVIKEDKPGFVNLLGIESPGLTSSMAIAEYVENMV